MNSNKLVFSVIEDNFNTNHFKLKMGNINIEELVEGVTSEEFKQSFHNYIKTLKAEGYQHLTFKVPTNKKKLVECALGENMNLADTLVRYLFDFSRAKLPEINHKCKLRDCRIEDLDQLKIISKSSFKIDRFHSDKDLPDELCDLYYEKWIENSYNGFADKVIVAYYNNEPVGYTTGKVYPEEKYGQLVLSAVSSKYRGLGTYTSMIHKGVEWMKNDFGDRVAGLIVGTQIDNIAVQKAWIKLNFTVYDSHYVFQKSL